MRLILAAAALTVCALSAQANEPGLHITEVYLPHHEDAARVAIWYPSAPTEQPSMYASNPVFEGLPAYFDAPLTAGKHPIVLFSHGMGGTDRSQAWLGASLAEGGVITVLVNHPNSTWGDFDMSEGVAHWTRAQDMSAALDAIVEHPRFAGGLDMSRVMAAGFSFGGWTALSLGGARGNHAGFVEACRALPKMEACGLLLSEGVAMQAIDPSLWNASYVDARVTHVTAIDPGFVWGLEPSDVAGLVPSVLLIGFGGEGDRMLATDFGLSGLSGFLEDARIEQFEPAYHFSAMPICTAAAEAILAVEDDDPVCTDPDGSDRAEIHDRIAKLMLEQLGL
ncbi:MAG: hypothetical protein AAF739_16035 [Pseudomonadota bacterium]